MWRLVIMLAMACTVLASAFVTARPVSAESCQFMLGFKTLHDLSPDTIGACVDNETHATNGDATQHTTKGLMAWRKTDNITAFTNGSTTWLIGPTGLVSRRNSERFRWENLPGTRDNPIPLGDTADIDVGLTLRVRYVVQYSDGLTPDDVRDLPEGYQLVVAAVTITNGGPGTAFMAGDSDFRAAAPLAPDDYSPTRDACQTFSAQLSPMEKIPAKQALNGSICFAVAAEDVEHLKLYYLNHSPQQGRLYFSLAAKPM
jgi:hypothetical protein